MQPLARKGGGALPPVALDYSTPAPVGGWNARDSIYADEGTLARLLTQHCPDQFTHLNRRADNGARASVTNGKL